MAQLHRSVVLLLLVCICAYEASKTCNIVKQWNYPCEDHTVTTSDGYILTMQRIPHGAQRAKPRGVVLFQHGLTDTSVGACLNSPSESLPYILADQGYEVWLGNNRGNGVSMGHIQYTPNDPEFWDFTWSDMAAYDMPAQISHVLAVTNHSKLSYIGHSEGTIQAFAALIEQPALAQQLHLYVALAPVAYVSNVESLILQAMAKLKVDDLFTLLGAKEFYLPNVLHQLLPGVCRTLPKWCNFVNDLLSGPTTYLNVSRLSYYLIYEPNPTSVKNMIHWAQSVRKGTFARFDYGTQGNMQHYNQPTAPAYEFQYFPANLPVALFAGGQDYLADPTDVQFMIAQLPGTPMVHIEPNYAHLDPLLGTNANQRIYPRILDLLQKYVY
jgi:pimeloyl-ACP methyl ester carboxylesterase